MESVFFFFRVLVFKLLLELNCFKMLRVIIVGLLRSGKVKIVCMLFVVICGKRLKNNFFGYEVENDWKIERYVNGYIFYESRSNSG